MYGPPQAPQVPQPQKSPVTGGRVALLVLFCALALLSCGFLAWAPMLRVAVLTRRALDWVLFGVTFAAGAALFAYAAATGDQESSTAEAFAAVGIMMLLVAGPLTYYLVTEIRRLDRGGAAPAYLPPGTTPPPPSRSRARSATRTRTPARSSRRPPRPAPHRPGPRRARRAERPAQEGHREGTGSR
ncbi:hypothetical protein O1L60_15190 [Streptomyces diastatochromogenes]|nr:hypothetical protein [Streptomyces diastatochromogenes]